MLPVMTTGLPLGKLPPELLARLLRGLPRPDPRVVTPATPGVDAAAIDLGDRVLIATADPITFLADRIGWYAVNVNANDIAVMGGEPRWFLATLLLPAGIAEAAVSAILADLTAACAELGVALVGGHTSEGAELSLGFAVTGLVDRASVLRKGGLAPGDALIVTKPIGTGTLLAAEMRGKAKARWVVAAIEHMTASNGAAAGILKRHGAHAATDVTGFGLLGHLVEMVKASGVDVTLHLAAVPLLDGARETLAMGIFSSLQPQNVRLRRAIRNLDEAARHPLYPMLFDPQTAGGLLASVPGKAAADCLAELRAGGYSRAAIIGRVAPPSDALEPVTLDLSDRPPPIWPGREPAGDAGRWTEAVRERERARGLVP